VFSAAGVYLFSKAALNHTDVVQFGFYWFAFGTVWSLLFANLRSFYGRIKSINGQAWRIYIVIGVLEMITTSFFYFAIKTIENPSIASFLSNLTPILVLLLGYFFLKEKFTKLVIAGMIMTIAGALIISYRVDTGFISFFENGSGYAYLASTFYAVSLTITRKNIGILYPKILTFNRTFLLFIFFATWMILSGQDFKIERAAYLPILVGSFVGPFL
jgi:drug/metabolite transporter (DMT)-like permease